MMMHRSPLQLSRRAAVSEPCLFCLFKNTGTGTSTGTGSYGLVQRRYMAARKAPSTRHSAWAKRARVLTPELQEIKQRQVELDKKIAGSTYLTEEQKTAIFGGNKALADRISDRMAYFVLEFRQSTELNDDFQKLMNRNGVPLKEIYEFTFVLRTLGNPSDANFGRYLVRCCDRAGYPEATIQLVASLLRQDIASPGRLRTREALLAQGRLKYLSINGNLRAKVLQGKLAERDGDPDLAIKLYQEAADGFSNRKEEDLLVTASADGGTTKATLDELSSPWMELGILHLRRGDRTKALQAYMLGISLDDPMAHHMLGRLDYQLSGGQYSADWLYNTVKAGASGHFRAAFALGEYYVNTKAPPLPTEDAITPHFQETGILDSLDTTDAPAIKTVSSFLGRLRHFFTTAFFKQAITLDSKRDIAWFASAVPDRIARVKLGYEWLKNSAEQAYLPAHMERARLHLRKYLLPEHNLTAPLIGPGSGEDEATPVENPLFHPETGRKLLSFVFLAHKRITNARLEAKTNASFRSMAGLWAAYPDVLEDYEPILDNLLEEAKIVADTMGIDIHDPERGIFYQHQGIRGQGLLEHKEGSSDSAVKVSSQ